ncbi:zeta toxin family protein [Mycobacterium intracellulare]|uniref:zeta toxin family protein n=1 Tax=Mycobacterium intracellulare TaxID=1767 RepID=UPI001EEF3F4A|nr:zeta toxin family protein [Mycobacterium intracellulare]MEE3755288.1 zeta toxin family protein [Mycobacterium intracellulare]
MNTDSDRLLRDAVAAQLARLTAVGGPLATDSPRATHRVFEDDPRRAQVRKRIVADYLAGTGSPVRDGASAVITAGAAGAGKSTAVNAVLGASAADYRRLDADLAKDFLLVDAVDSGLFDDLLSMPLGDGRPVAPRELAALVHHESTQIWDALRRHCIDRGERILIEGTLSWPPLGMQLLTELRNSGYSAVHVVAVEVAEPVAQQRAVDRWWHVRRAGADALGGRFMPPDVIGSAYRADGTSICTANALALLGSGEDVLEGPVVTVDVVDESGAIRRMG